MKVTLIRLREFWPGSFELNARKFGSLTDRLCSDQVSDAILDACLAEDPLSKVLMAPCPAGPCKIAKKMLTMPCFNRLRVRPQLRLVSQICTSVLILED